MCSEYKIKTTDKAIQDSLNQAVKNLTEKKKWDETIKLTKKAPALRLNGEKLELIERIFPANPFPNARLSGVEKDDENISEEEQVRRIYHLTTWKKGFVESPLLLPMTGFLEPVYWGAEKGSVVEFQIPNEPIFFAAGIEIKPRVPKTEKADGFALITHTATKQMLKYHHRLVVVFKPEDAIGYLEAESAEERFNYILENRVAGLLDVEKSRQMAKGWEKRVELQRKKLDREQKYTNVLKREGVTG